MSKDPYIKKNDENKRRIKLNIKHLKDTMVRGLMVIFVADLFLTCQFAYSQQDIKGNFKLLKLILPTWLMGEYTIVEPKTTLDPIKLRDTSEVSIWKITLKKRLAITDYDIGPLIDVFFEINRQSVSIDLKSDTLAGYWIDNPVGEARMTRSQLGPADRLFGKDVSYTCVSIPAYDKAKGIVLIYLSHPGPIGAGQIIAYRLKGGKLILLKRVQVWIS
jgi:hypothetical protein